MAGRNTRDLAGYAGPEGAGPLGVNVGAVTGYPEPERPPSLLSQIKAAISVPDLVAAVVQGVAVSAAVAYVVERRTRR